MGARLGICLIVSYVNHFKHVLFSTIAISICSLLNLLLSQIFQVGAVALLHLDRLSLRLILTICNTLTLEAMSLFVFCVFICRFFFTSTFQFSNNKSGNLESYILLSENTRL